MVDAQKTLKEQALDYHAALPYGKLAVAPSKPLATQKDLSLAYSPGVAYPCLEIHQDPKLAYKYTSKGNVVAVVSNGTAILGLGNLGALASKPVMEGKSVLFKKFSGVDSIDIEVNSENTDEIIKCVQLISPTFGGINLEDIKAPECFIVEDALKKSLSIPVFHDDQHGTAVITLAGLINAFEITNKDFKTARFVIIGAGAAAIACATIMRNFGIPKENLTLCDTTGVIYQGRTAGMNPWKEKFAVNTTNRTISDAVKGADVVIGLSKKGLLTPDMVKSMNKNPIIFAMANPDPEITPEEVKQIRDDAIMATGRSDYPNQINNVMAFPYIFRGALDTRSTQINEEMKMAAARSLAELARQPVTAEVAKIYSGQVLEFGPQYIVPKPFDSRLLVVVSTAVAKAAIESGVAQNKTFDLNQYKKDLEAKVHVPA